MSESDKDKVLLMYNRIFDDAVDEEQLSSLLVSPTRQAVFLARAYNNKNRADDLRVRAGNIGGENIESAEPDFIRAVKHVRQEAANRGLVSSVSSSVKPVAHSAGSAESQFKTTKPSYEERFATSYDGLEDDTYIEPEIPAFENSSKEDNFSYFDSPEADSIFEAEDFAENIEYEHTEDFDDEISEAESNILEMIKGINSTIDSINPSEISKDNSDDFSSEDEEDEISQEPLRKTNVGLLLIFIIFAIPIALLGIAVILIPALISFVLAVAFVAGGIFTINSALTGFTILADVLILFGLAFIFLALGLFFAWTFIWFIGNVIPELIRGLIKLGRKLCTKEVKE